MDGWMDACWHQLNKGCHSYPHAPADPRGVLALGRRRYPDLDVARRQPPHLVQEPLPKACDVHDRQGVGCVCVVRESRVSP